MASADKCRTGQDITPAVGPSSDAPAVSLDDLPPELLLHIFSWLDWSSLVELDSVSVRCKEAITLHLGRLRLFRVGGSLWRELCAEKRPCLPGLLPTMTGLMSQLSEPASALAALLSRMAKLRELHVDVKDKLERPQDLLTAVVSASCHWPLLEQLKMSWRDHTGIESDLLRQLCANCVGLNSVTLGGDGFNDDNVEAVVTKLPALRTLRVCSGKVRGSFVSQLPTDLHDLMVWCGPLCSWPLSDLLRCRELRSLELSWSVRTPPPEPAQLVSVLVGCVHLETLSLDELDEEFVACLPPDGLPTLRHLAVKQCVLNDAEFSRLVERLPGLESVSLKWCYNLTPQGLAPLGRLPSLRVLRLGDHREGCISDWLLTQLSAAPLVELELPVESLLDDPTYPHPGEPIHLSKTLSVDGFLRLIRHCKSLTVLILCETNRCIGTERINCGAGVPEQDVEQAIRLFVNRKATTSRPTPWDTEYESESE